MDEELTIINNTGRREPLAVEVANKIAKMVRDEKFEAGSRIPNEFELSDKFGVGRGTIREAVKLLCARNVLQIVPAKGTFVCENPGVADDPLGLDFIQDKSKMIYDLLDLRSLLECYVAKHAAEVATEEQIAELKKIVQCIDNNSDDNDACIKYDIEFHKCLAESSGNTVISTVLPVIRSSLENFNALNFDREWDVVNSSHKAIIKAVESRNPALAEAETIRHLSYNTEKLKQMNL